MLTDDAPPVVPEAPPNVGIRDGRFQCLRCGGTVTIMFASIDGPNRHGCTYCEDSRTIALRAALAKAEDETEKISSAWREYAEAKDEVWTGDNESGTGRWKRARARLVDLGEIKP